MWSDHLLISNLTTTVYGHAEGLAEVWAQSSARVRGPRVSEEESLGIGRQGHARQHHVCVLSLPQTWHLDLGAAAAATVLAIRTSDRFRSRGTVMCTLKLRIMTPEFL